MTRKYELILLLIAILPQRFVLLLIVILGRLYLMFTWFHKCLLRHHIPDNVFIDTQYITITRYPDCVSIAWPDSLIFSIEK